MIVRETAEQQEPKAKFRTRLSELNTVVDRKDRMLKIIHRRYKQQLIKQKKLEKELKELHKHINVLSVQLAQAEKRERRNIATRLHEKVGQFLVLARMKAGKLKGLSEQHEYIGSVASDIDTLIDSAIESIKNIIFDLNPPQKQESNLPSMMACIHKIMEKESGILFTVKGLEAIDIREREIDNLLCSAMRELIINSLRHAHAKNLCICFEQTKDRIRITVIDDGIGFDPSLATGFGLYDIRERIRAVGGSIELNSAPEKGTQVVIDAPIRLPYGYKETDAP